MLTFCFGCSLVFRGIELVSFLLFDSCYGLGFEGLKTHTRVPDSLIPCFPTPAALAIPGISAVLARGLDMGYC